MEDHRLRLKRLRLAASRRGLLEAELALAPFVDKELEKLSEPELDVFERLLKLEDLDLWEMLSGRRAPAPDIDLVLIEKIRDCLPGKLQG